MADTAAAAPPIDTALKHTPLDALHRELGGRMVPFAGYDMPVQYPDGIMKEHVWTRESAGLFDVSHMGQAILRADGVVGDGDGDARHAAIAAAFETLVPGDIAGLAPGRMRYTQLTNEAGGILDDLMVTRPQAEADQGTLYLVVNAARKDADFAHIRARLQGRATLEPQETAALVALQGPKAAAVLARHCPGAADLTFMTSAAATLDGVPVILFRAGYTGEDGYEISLPAVEADRLARLLLAEPEVKPIGLGARDSLRLEAGLCLYGSDIDETTTPVEAGLTWSIGKRRRTEGGFPGAETILHQLEHGPRRKRVGLKPEGRAPVRAHAEIRDAAGTVIGEVTSGGFAPSLQAPIAKGYVAADHAAPGTAVQLVLRGKAVPAEVVTMPFWQQRYHRG